MPITRETAARNADCSAIVSLLDRGSLYSTGHLSIYTSDASLITWHNLSVPAFGAPNDGTSIANPIDDAVAIMDGTANNFSFDNRDGTAIWRGDITLVGYGGALLLDSLSIPHDSTIAIASATYVSTASIFAIQGSTGLYGPTGIMGLQGMTGLGVQGYTGVGMTGIQGLTGLGSTGVQGDVGSTGIMGLTGIQGLGVTGLQGILGGTGILGNTGSTGILGMTGLLGNQGATGIIGLTGLRGPVGAGTTGVQGLTGLQGITGIKGLGLTGLQGNTGFQGVQGSGGATLFLDDSTANIGGYHKLISSPSILGEIIDSVSVDSTSGLGLIESYISDITFPGTSVIVGGIWDFSLYRYVSDATGVSQIKIGVYTRTTDSTETELFNAFSQEIDDTSVALEEIYSIQPDFVVSSNTNRLVVKYFGLTTSPSSIQINLVHNGPNHYSHFHTPIALSGNQGVTGLFGFTGFIGATGLYGPTGILGLQGVTGIRGLTGLIGLTGITGQTGIFGLTGIFGVTGLQGNTGISGVTGVVGGTGVQVKTGSYNFSMSTAIGAIPTGIMGQVSLTGNNSFSTWTVLTDVTSSINVDVQKSTYAGYPNFSSWNGNTGIFISSGLKNTGTTGYWSGVTGASGDILRVILSGSDASASKVTLNLGYTLF